MSPDEHFDKRQQILSAAEKLIAELGFQGLSMSKLAKEAGVAAGTIYRYFTDKEHLLDELRLRITRRVATAVQANVSDDMPLKQRYRTMWFNTWNLAASNLSTISNRAQYDSLPCSRSPKTREQEKQMFHQVSRLFNQGKEQGVFKPLDNEILFALSLETSIQLSRKHAFGLYQLDEAAQESAVEASWDAIINH
ncbi:TetR family transcriptional regulator [Vibrio navarrensis]|uniref:TetR/AcrR family transcriptional regulator n=1 Tax=Vibrio navarrensis TaxID=29495 RepID=UPI001869782D|nr:TetR/AcrR family transcriptional regulator [Vibrio navarrensis]MBE3669898.1 TetR family transcriptional regulator [Vibrio navarrensis]MBE4592434.1 TetR family transcriptional regulator [Vibrio navarrensis]